MIVLQKRMPHLPFLIVLFIGLTHVDPTLVFATPSDANNARNQRRLDGIMPECELGFGTIEVLTRDMFAEVFSTGALLEILNKHGVNYHAKKLRRTVLDKEGFLREDFYNYLPPWDKLPRKAFNEFSKLSCTYVEESNKKMVKYCNSRNQLVENMPKSASVAFGDLDVVKRGKIVRTLCEDIVTNWDFIMAKIVTLYERAGLVFVLEGADVDTDDSVHTNHSVYKNGADNETDAGTEGEINTSKEPVQYESDRDNADDLYHYHSGESKFYEADNDRKDGDNVSHEGSSSVDTNEETEFMTDTGYEDTPNTGAGVEANAEDHEKNDANSIDAGDEGFMNPKKEIEKGGETQPNLRSEPGESNHNVLFIGEGVEAETENLSMETGVDTEQAVAEHEKQVQGQLSPKSTDSVAAFVDGSVSASDSERISGNIIFTIATTCVLVGFWQ